MTQDALLSDDLATLLGHFPNDALRDLVGILKQHGSWSPFAASRAYAAHAVADDGDFAPPRARNRRGGFVMG
ncbi:MAG: hypothetical protein AB7P02_05575 [Alphaproteobacteria bacterium]